MPAFAEPLPAPIGETAQIPVVHEEPKAEAPAAAEAAAPPQEAPAASRPLNWDAIVEDLQGLADNALGARSRKVKDLLGSAERTQMGVESAVAQVSQISLLFVDSALLVKLEQDMRAQLQNYL